MPMVIIGPRKSIIIMNKYGINRVINKSENVPPGIIGIISSTGLGIIKGMKLRISTIIKRKAEAIIGIINLFSIKFSLCFFKKCILELALKSNITFFLLSSKSFDT